MKAFPKGAEDDDFVVISGKIHTWNRRRGMFTTNEAHVPEDHNQPVITLFTELTDGGVLTDFMGKKWQLQPFAERVSMPVIRIEDVTAIDYPELTGHYNAIFLVTITHEDSEAEIWYKIVENGNEPETFTKYNDPIRLKSNGTYQIVAKAKKEGVTDSEVVRSESFKVVRAVVSETYGRPQIDTFAYQDFPANGGSAAPTLTYHQYGSRIYTDGSTESLTPITSGATFTFRAVHYATSIPYSIDTLTGGLSVGRTTITHRQPIVSAYVIVHLNGADSDEAEATVFQKAADKANDVIRWEITPPQSVDSGRILVAGTDFKAFSVSGVPVKYYVLEEGTYVEITSIKIEKYTAIYAKTAGNDYYNPASSVVYVGVNEIPQVYYGFGLTEEEFNERAYTPDGARDLIETGSDYYQLSAPDGNIDKQLTLQTGQVFWIAVSLRTFPNIDLRQNDYPATIDWIDADTTFYEEYASGRRIYHVYYAKFRGSFTLKGITW